ncbi:MAG: helix-turn-helix domain-containing protein [Bacteroidales bacterium]|nr:helix-turn-helix domain-containing protein [Bacteroidales bacterium]
MKLKRFSTILLLAVTIVLPTLAATLNVSSGVPSYRIVKELDELPFKEVTDLVYDSDDLLWMATRNGLYCYDNYRIRPYRRDGRHPDMLTDNEVKRVTEDRQQRIWIATAQGLDRLDKKTGRIEHLVPAKYNIHSITELMVTRDGTVWIASDDGFFYYLPTDDVPHPVRILDERGEQIAFGQCMMEDHRGFIWLGTWSNGLYRYSPQDGTSVHYPQMNDRNSAHVLLEDDHKRIWVAGWASGIHVLDNAWEMDRLSWQTFTTPDLIGNITYSMTFDAERQQIMIGSSRGMTIADTEHLGTFYKLADSQDGHPFPGVEITGIEKSDDGLTWVSMIGQGVMAIEPDQAHFGHSTLENSRKYFKTSSIRSIYADRHQRLWLGIGTQGLAVQDLKTGASYNWNEIPALSRTHQSMSTVYAITETYDGHIWVANFNSEIMEIVPPKEGDDIRRLTATIYYSANTPFAPSDRIFTLFEDRNDNLWIGGTGGAVMRRPNGSVLRLDTLQMDPKHRMRDLEVQRMAQSSDGSLLLAALHAGVYRMRFREGRWQVECFNAENEGIGDNEIQSLCLDKQDRLWAGSKNGDLYVLYPGSKRFRSVKEDWHLPGASINFIIEDRSTMPSREGQHSLWVGTNEGLLQIITSLDLKTTRIIHYNEEDGLLDNYLVRSAATTDYNGHIYFGTHKGYNFFNAEQLAQDKEKNHRVKISQLLVEDTPWQELPDEERNKVSALDPRYSSELTFTHEQSEFTLEFSQTGFTHKKEIQFAYMLEGYDEGWRYASGSLPQASYSNLPAGEYTFLLCSAHHTYSSGSTNPTNDEDVLKVAIAILPSWWETTTAKVIYALLGILAVLLLQKGFRMLKTRYKHLLIRARERAAIRKGEIILKPSKPDVTDADKDFIRRAIDCINNHLSDPDYDQQQFLDDMGVSKATCFRKLKAMTGQSYTNFVRDIKMKAALKLQQENPNIRISDLAYAVGFSDPKYFSACFKKYYGKLPSDVIEDKKDKNPDNKDNP